MRRPQRARRCVLVLALMAIWLAAAPVTAQQMTAPAASTPAAAAPAQPGPTLVPAAPTQPKIDSGDTAWMLTSAALVLMMTAPGLALFYGGMVRRHNVLGTIMQSFILMAVVSIQWVLWGYSVAFGPDVHGVTGSLAWLGLKGVGLEPYPDYAATIPHQAFMVYQLMFAIITPALITGAFAERIKFSGFLLFTLLWVTVIYDPLAHWVWGVGGWLRKAGALDFAGGTVVHISSGVSALATSAFVVTHTATAAAALAWMLTEWLSRGKPTVLGAASGAVAGLVAITPASGYVGPLSAIVIGAVGGFLCYTACNLKSRLGYDDSLDVVGVHGVGGTWGALATGLFASAAINDAGGNGLFFGNPGQLPVQALSVLVTVIFAFVGSLILLKLVDAVIGLRIHEEDEVVGLDLSQHNESAYALGLIGSVGVGSGRGTPGQRTATDRYQATEEGPSPILS